MRAHPQGTRFNHAFVASFSMSAPAERSVGNCSPAKKVNFRFSRYLQDYNVPHTSIGSLYLYTNVGLLALRSRYPLVPRFQAKQNDFCGDLRTRRFDSDAANGERRRTVEQYNMRRASKEPDIIFLQVGCNDFPRTARNQRDADAFSLQLLELASLLNDRYKAKRVVVGCILSRFSARKCRRDFSPLEVRQYSGWAQAVNTGLTDHSQKVPHITVWKHNAKFTFQESRRGLFSDDGVHLSTQGQYLLCKSIRRAMIAACHSLQ